MPENDLIIYKNSDGDIIVDAIYKDETLWLSQKGMSKVFEVGVPAISKHLKNIFEENELDKNSVVSKMEITTNTEKQRVPNLISRNIFFPKSAADSPQQCRNNDNSQ